MSMMRQAQQTCNPGSVSRFLDKLVNFPGKEIRFVNIGDRQRLGIHAEITRMMSRSNRDLHHPMRLKQLIIKVDHIEASKIYSKYLIDEIDEAKTRRPTCIEDKLGDL